MIKIKRLSKVVLLFSIILIFGGCYDYNELNSLLCSATHVLPIYESENKKIGLLK